MINEKLDKIVGYALAVSALAMVLYHLVFARNVLQGPIGHQNTHLGFSLLILFLAELRTKQIKKRLLCFICLILSLTAVVYIQANIDALEMRSMMNTQIDLIIGVILILVVIIGSWIAFGPVLSIIATLFMIYAVVGHYFPPPFNAMSISFDELISKWSIGLSGIYGPILTVSANFIFLFMLFAGLVSATGAVDFFAQVGKLFGRYFRAGPAMAAVITSGLMGSISGSAAANVMITGSFTIPAMKRRGYRPEQAGGIEAAASTGGPIFPPVMGVTAFIMCGITGIAYSKIILVAIIPAFLYILTAGAYAELQARKMGLLRRKEEVDVKLLINRMPLFIISFAAIVILFLLGNSPMLVGFWSSLIILFLSLMRKETRLSLGGLVRALTEAAITGARVGVSCAALGLVISSVVMAGLGIKLPIYIGNAFGHNLAALLVMTAIVTIILGCGLPASAAYILTVISVAPVLLKIGIPLLSAHFFVFFFANFSFITPPVAIAALFGAQLAEASYLRTSIEAAKVGIAGFILPFVIVFCPAIMFDFSAPLDSLLKLTAVVIALIVLQTGIVGHYFTNINFLERGLTIAVSLTLLSYLFTGNLFLFFIGLSIIVIFTLWKIIQMRRVQC